MVKNLQMPLCMSKSNKKARSRYVSNITYSQKNIEKLLKKQWTGRNKLGFSSGCSSCAKARRGYM